MCVMPWVNLHVATSGAISPCCEFDGSIGNCDRQTLGDAWRGEALARIRAAFLAGQKLPACRKCIDREPGEGTSLRLQSNARFAQHFARIGKAPPDAFPAALDLRFSNLCNFKCRSCWHGASSKWFSDAKALGKARGEKAEISSFDSVENFMAQVSEGLPKIAYVYFAGGEPLVQPEHYALLRELTRLGRTDVVLAYNTNMSVTALKDDSIFELWKRFPRVTVEASVDATGELGALMRSGFDWKVFAANVRALKEACPHVGLHYGVTVSVMNVMALPELFAALGSELGAGPGDIYLHSLQDPEFYRTQVLPPEMKAKAAAGLRVAAARFIAGRRPGDPGVTSLLRQIEGIIRYMAAQDLRGQLPRLRWWSRNLDRLRQEDSRLFMAGLD